MRVAGAAALAGLIAGCAGQRPSAGAPPRPSSESPEPAASAPPAEGPRVAITLDDLGSTQESSDPALSRRILDELGAAQAPVAVFVNCQALNDDTLRLWQRAGATVGNHTATHLSIDAAGPNDAWRQDVESCDTHLKGVLGAPVKYFRYPYMRYGSTTEARLDGARELATLGYSVAHVTAATSEWLLAGYYERALVKGDAALVRDLVAAYTEHMLKTLEAARELAVRKLGRDVLHITLAHVNRLSGDHLSDVLAALQGQGFRFIDLKEALSDPVYALPDAYVGGCGCSWLARIPPALTRDDPYVFGDYEAELRARFEARLPQEVVPYVGDVPKN
ncbi:MAG TPA: polysaccharide deacetylase family protein [Polyangiaceae bacterium]|jgi:peptidoglycan/xylan/chitin deacetylase (PgdA/CDA1 family)|nr:polysaccharide deacetylase family protein [Polyangiaceae bacterium]